MREKEIGKVSRNFLRKVSLNLQNILLANKTLDLASAGNILLYERLQPRPANQTMAF